MQCRFKSATLEAWFNLEELLNQPLKVPLAAGETLLDYLTAQAIYKAPKSFKEFTVEVEITTDTEPAPPLGECTIRLLLTQLHGEQEEGGE